jgi:hypothetical protein
MMILRRSTLRRLMMSARILAIALIASTAGCLEPFPEPKTPPKKPASSQPARSNKGDDKKQEKQTYAEAWQLICQAPKLADLPKDIDRRQRATLVTDWIIKNVTNKKARYWWIAYGQVKPHQREAYFRREATAMKQMPCPLTEILYSKPAKNKQPAKPAVPQNKPPGKTSDPRK